MIYHEKNFTTQESEKISNLIFNNEMNQFNIKKKDYKITYALEKNDGSTTYDTFHQIGSIGFTPFLITIGLPFSKKELYNNLHIQDDKFIWILHQTYHEALHCWQYANGFLSNNPPDNIKQAAKDFVIGSFMPEYKRNAYVYNTAELNADRYAVKNTKTFINNESQNEKRLSNINIDLIQYENEIKRHAHAFPILYNCRTSEDITNAYAKMIQISKDKKKFKIHKILTDEKIINYSNGFKEIISNKEIIAKINACENGTEETDILCEYIGKNHPEYFNSVPCIKNEYCKQKIILSAMTKLMNMIRPIPEYQDPYHEKEIHL